MKRLCGYVGAVAMLVVLTACGPKTAVRPLPTPTGSATTSPAPPVRCKATTPDGLTGIATTSCLTANDVKNIFGSDYDQTDGYLFYAFASNQNNPAVHFVLASGPTASQYWHQELERYGEDAPKSPGGELSTYGVEYMYAVSVGTKDARYFSINFLYAGSRYADKLPTDVYAKYDTKLRRALLLVKKRFLDDT
jgi:hypothetical protein